MTIKQLPNEMLLAVALGSGNSSAAIEMQEKHGQSQVVHSDVIPVEYAGYPRPDQIEERDAWFERHGFKMGERVEGDPIFQHCTLPDGWSKRGTGHSMHSEIVDQHGRARVNIFYKAAFYDRRANKSILSRFSYKYENVDKSVPENGMLPQICRLIDSGNVVVTAEVPSYREAMDLFEKWKAKVSPECEHDLDDWEDPE